MFVFCFIANYVYHDFESSLGILDSLVRNESCALNLISTFLLHHNCNAHGISWIYISPFNECPGGSMS